MFGFLKKLFSPPPVENVNFRALANSGAILIDVRTPNEFRSGHIKKSKNIPVRSIKQSIDVIKKYNKPIITYCRSGQRAALATRILRQNGIKAYNGGGIQELSNKLTKRRSKR